MIYKSDKFRGTPILAAAQSPAVDVVAFGLGDGRVMVHNIRADKKVVKFKHTEADGAIVAGGAQRPQVIFVLGGPGSGKGA